MARNGSGTFELASGNPVISGTTISSSWANNTLSDIASALTQSIAADGQTPISANIPFNGFKLQGVGDGVLDDDVMTVGQGVTLAALADTSNTALGDALIGVKRTLTNAIATNLHNYLDGSEINVVRDFGATGLGVVDDWAAFNNAVNAASALTNKVTKIIVPAGTYLWSQQLIISNPIKFIGEGAGYIANAGFTATVGSRIKYTGGATAVISFSNVNFGGFGISGIDIDANNLATTAMIVSDSVGGNFSDISLRNATTRGLWLRSTNTFLSNTNSWHRFEGLNVDCPLATDSCIRESGITSGGNACHNSFVNTRVVHGSTGHGIVLGGCDNNSHLMTYIYRAGGGTGYGVFVDSTEVSGFPINNTFFHIEAVGGYFQPAGFTQVPAHLYGYMLDNGEPIPALNTNGSLAIVSPDIVYPLTVAAGTGWSGGAPTFTAYYTRSGRKVTVVISAAGTAMVLAAGATITGLPATTVYGLGVIGGVNYGGAGGIISGYQNGTTAVVSTGVTSSAGFFITAEFIA